MITTRRRRLSAWIFAASTGLFITAHSQSDEIPITPTGVDHLLYASATLERGMDEIESLLGVRPVPGGHHPQYGTHNALLSLGPGIYLEVIARDPQLSAPAGGALIDIPANAESRLITWVYRVADIEGVVSVATSAAIGLGNVESGSRKKPDGSKISWHLTDPYAMPMDGAIPFLINWGNTVHPSAVVPSGGRLVEFVIEHPEPGRIRSALSILGAEIKVVKSDEYRLTAKIESETGLVTLD